MEFIRPLSTPLYNLHFHNPLARSALSTSITSMYITRILDGDARLVICQINTLKIEPRLQFAFPTPCIWNRRHIQHSTPSVLSVEMLQYIIILVARIGILGIIYMKLCTFQGLKSQEYCIFEGLKSQFAV